MIIPLYNTKHCRMAVIPVAIMTWLCSLALAPLSIAAGAAADWKIKEAPVRVMVSLAGGPSHKSCGYVALLPDGGIFPGPYPMTQVVAEDGRKLASYVLWYNKGQGLMIVFEDPGSVGDVSVYVSGAANLKTWSSSSGLTPGPVFCAESGAGSQEVSQSLGRMGAVGPRAYFDHFGTSGSPLGLSGGDPQGRPTPASYYILAYAITSDPGKTFVSLNITQGACQLRIDGQPLSPRKISGKPMSDGQWLNLANGLHRVEGFSSIAQPGKWSIWVMGWKPPKATIEQLGGARAKDLPFPGTAMWESHKVNGNEIARSGKCRIREVSSRDGLPLAVFKKQAVENFWFGDEPPVLVYEFDVLAAGNPQDTEYTWSFGDAAKVSGQKVSWFLNGGNHTITLTASSGGKQSTCTVPFYAFSGVQSSMNSQWTKDNFRKACLSMIKSYPLKTDPTASWGKTMWNCFFDSLEFGEGRDLLEEIFSNRWTFFSKKIPDEKKAALEDIFFNLIQTDGEKVLKWLDEREAASSSDYRKKELKIMRAEFLMYQKNDYKEAKKLLFPIAAGTGEAADLANIRLGDIAFLERNMNDANKHWGVVQNAVKMDKKDIKGENGKQIKWADGSAKTTQPKEQKTFSISAANNEPIESWKKAASWETSKALSVTALMTQGCMLEAYHELRQWEHVSPMSKINSDYIIQEATFYQATGNFKRARKMLEAYCENVDSSAYVANAVEMLFNCMLRDKESDKVLEKFATDMKKRFEFHPLAEKMNDLIRMVTTGIKREATKDKIEDFEIDTGTVRKIRKP